MAASMTATDYYDLGAYQRTVTTTSDDAQTWFDRGLNWLYGFNHAEAIVCFERALEADPGCAMAHWGIAMGIGPNYNLPWYLMDRRTRANAISTAFEASEAARALVDSVTPVEAALIESLIVRYPQGEPADEVSEMLGWNLEFTAAMRDLATQFADDLEVQAVFVDAILNETPWQMWNLTTGEPADDAKTVEAQAALDRAFD